MSPLRTLVLFLLLVGLVSGAVAADGVHVYIGTYTGKGSEGIYVCRFDPASGELQAPELAARTDNPSFLAAAPNGRFLYAVNEVDTFDGKPTGAISVFSVSGVDGGLKLDQQVSSVGSGPAHLSLDRGGRYLLVANYGGGNVAVFPVGADGRLGPHTSFQQAYGSSVRRDRQASPHAHYVVSTPDNTYALVADLGIDKILVYRFDERSGVLSADTARDFRMNPGSGPRHIALREPGRYVYVANELTSSVAVLVRDSVAGTLEARQTLSTVPVGFTGGNTVAEIILDSRGKFLYVSNRGDDSIVVFSVDSSEGTVRQVQRIPSGGRSPRHISLDPTGHWLFAANQKSDAVHLFMVNPDTGQLTSTGRSVSVASPVCVLSIVQ